MIKVYVDAAFKHHQAGIGVVIYDGQQQKVKTFFIDEVLDNHHAEFQGMILALDFLVEQQLNDQTIQLFSDSLIVVKAIERLSVKNDWQKPYLEQIMNRLEKFTLYFIRWFSQKENAFVDKVAKRALLSAQDIV